MLVVGSIGLVINVICIFLLRGGAGESLNVKGAYLEVIADTLGSVGVIVAALLVSATGSAVWDTVIALAIAVFVLVRAVMLGREVLAVLGQHAPAGIEPTEMLAALESVDGVFGVHDLHVWTLTSGMDVATAHLVTEAGDPEQVLAAARAVLHDQFAIAHATLQVETTRDRQCSGVNW
jgi:cobalt-zinc-cadmium efflux system protein